MEKHFTYVEKSAGDPVSHEEWNNLAQDVEGAVNAINQGGTPTAIDTSGVISVSSKGNITIGSNSIKNVNIEPGYPYSQDSSKYGDIALKPGDDIQFASHHREAKKRDKIVVKNIDGSDNPVKLQIVAGEIDLAVGTENNPKTATRKKDKNTGADTNEALFKVDDAKVMDLRILTGITLDPNTNDEREERGYLKVRAQAIDLRCEKHGGIALQPKGYDSDGNMNKIKFEHGGGDGLEFGTFNTEKSSLYTNEYRFKRDGIWKMATRTTVPNQKTIYDDNTPIGKQSTAASKYQKQLDDFYDIIDVNDEQCTTKDIIKTAFAMNGGKDRHTKITNKGAIEISTNETYQITLAADNGSAVNVNTISTEIAALSSIEGGEIFNDGDFEVLPTDATVYTNGTQYFTFTVIPAPDIKIDSGAGLKLGGILDFGSSFNFGETDNGIEVQYKLTKKNATKDCGIIKVVGYNNSTSQDLTVEGVTIPAKSSSESDANVATIAQCSILDIIKLVNYMKTNNEGPWAAQL